jgi:DNA-directed RNA polymerase I, II, and III subunit RPABC2
MQKNKEIDLKNKILVGPPRLTRFEKARIIGARALQISMGAPILTSPSKKNFGPIDITLKELELDMLPITIRRNLPDGVNYQDIPLTWLI